MVASIKTDRQAADEMDVAAPALSHSHSVDVQSYVWLERRHGESSTIDKHSYCRECGVISHYGNGGRQVSFFIQGIASLVEYTERRKLERITQSEARLLMKKIVADMDIADPYSTTLDIQVERFICIIKNSRPGFSDEMIVHALFRKKQKKR